MMVPAASTNECTGERMRPLTWIFPNTGANQMTTVAEPTPPPLYDYWQYTLMPISEVPHPQGLGKVGHEELRTGMKQLLGARHESPDAHEAAFWTPKYQRLIEKHLKPTFDQGGDIVDIAQQVASIAEHNPVIGQRLSGLRPDAENRYWAGLPPLDDGLSQYVKSWIDYPPEITLYANGKHLYDGGRHRIAYLRYRVQRVNPDFRVLVNLNKLVSS